MTTYLEGVMNHVCACHRHVKEGCQIIELHASQVNWLRQTLANIFFSLKNIMTTCNDNSYNEPIY